MYYGFDLYGNVCGRKENFNIFNVILLGIDMSDWLYFLYFDLIKIKLGKLFVNFLLEKVNFKLWEDFKLLLIKDDF